MIFYFGKPNISEQLQIVHFPQTRDADVQGKQHFQ